MDTQQRISAKSPFAGKRMTGFKSVWRNLLLFLVFVLMALPLFTTFNEILTKVVEGLGIYTWLAQWVVPFYTRSVALILRPLGIDGQPTISHLFVKRPDGSMTGIYFSWNCLGWQSGLLLVLTLITGLGGNFSWDRKAETVALGVSGTFLINLVRITVVTVVAYYFGQLPATIVHDYGGTLFTVVWFLWFWWFAYRYILEGE